MIETDFQWFNLFNYYKIKFSSLKQISYVKQSGLRVPGNFKLKYIPFLVMFSFGTILFEHFAKIRSNKKR